SAATSDAHVWDEEVAALEAILDDRFKTSSHDQCSIRADSDSAVPATYYFRRPASGYPDTPPIITIDAPDVPSYVRLSAIKRAVTYAQDNLCGDSMIFNLLEWLESSMPDIIQKPG